MSDSFKDHPLESKDLSALYALTASGVHPEVACLRVLGKANPRFIDQVKQLQEQEGLDYSRAILTMAAKQLDDPSISERLNAAFEESRQEIDRIEQHPRFAIAAAAGEGPQVTMNRKFFNGLTDQIQEDRKLSQFLGVSLRGVLPYAEQECAALHEAAHRDDDEELRQQAEGASRAITRAQASLNRLEASEFPIKDLPDDAFDDDFQVIFDDEYE